MLTAGTVQHRGTFTTAVKELVRRAALTRWPERLYPVPASSLQPERLYLLLDVLWRTREVDGAMVELGCWLGGTTAIASKFLERIGRRREYVAVDTFGGFVKEQFDHDSLKGTPDAMRSSYDQNSREIVARLLRYYGTPPVRLLEADVTRLAPDELPAPIAVCLVDVDLEIPVDRALQLVWPLMAEGGIVLVDDCPHSTTWRARAAYERFCADHQIEPLIEFGMGVLER
jgi:O-methyltransferase